MKKIWWVFALVCLLPLAGGSRQTASAYGRDLYAGRDFPGLYAMRETPAAASMRLECRIGSAESAALGGEELGEIAYRSEVSAEYTFTNPTHEPLLLPLAYPFGAAPGYGVREELSRYTVQGAEPVLRHTLAASFAENGAPSIAEGPRAAGALRYDAPVTVYRYRMIPERGTSDWSSVMADFAGLGDPAATRVMLSEFSHTGMGEEDVIGIWGNSFREGPREFSLFVIGAPLFHMPEWQLCDHFQADVPTAGSVELIGSEESTFGALVMQKSPQSGVRGDDWFNAVLDRLSQLDGTASGRLTLRAGEDDLNVEDRLMRWYCFELELPAQGSASVTLSAPLFPTVMGGSGGTVYEFRLSAGIRTLVSHRTEVVTDQPFESSLPFSKTDRGYCYEGEGEYGSVAFRILSDVPFSDDREGGSLWGFVPLLFPLLLAELLFEGAFGWFSAPFLWGLLAWIVFAAIGAVLAIVLTRRKK